MISNHRTAFENKSHNEALEYNLDKVVNLTSLKMKELINKKQDKIREGNQLKAQKSVIESDIAYYEKENKDKIEEINKLLEEFMKTQAEIEELEKENKICQQEYNNQDENFKLTVNAVNDDLDSISVVSGVEETNKKSDTRMEYENYIKIKTENKQLMDKMHELRTDLYYLEINYKKAADDEIQRIYKTRKGIDTINKMDQ